jgi:peptidoglycan-associated lipoprotein
MRQLLFGLKFSSVLAVLALLVACAEKTVDTDTTSGGGEAAQPTATASQPPVTQVEPKPEVPSVVPGGPEDLVLNVGDRIFFDFDKYSLNAEAQATLQRQAAWLNKHPNNQIAIEGHCDERGTREYNLGLGDRRANAAKEYLVSLGVGAGRIETISFGKERPVALGNNEASWSQNRRGVTIVAN